jgi:hypothetical protein
MALLLVTILGVLLVVGAVVVAALIDGRGPR